MGLHRDQICVGLSLQDFRRRRFYRKRNWAGSGAPIDRFLQMWRVLSHHWKSEHLHNVPGPDNQVSGSLNIKPLSVIANKQRLAEPLIGNRTPHFDAMAPWPL